MADLESKITTVLKGSTAVSALVGGRVFPLVLDQGCQFPAVSFLRVSGGKQFGLSGYSGLEGSRIQVDCWATTYKQAKALAAAVSTAMRAATTFRVSAVNDRDLFEDAQNLYRVSIDFTCWHRE